LGARVSGDLERSTVRLGCVLHEMPQKNDHVLILRSMSRTCWKVETRVLDHQ
jgi:hypothetical protein